MQKTRENTPLRSETEDLSPRLKLFMGKSAAKDSIISKEAIKSSSLLVAFFNLRPLGGAIIAEGPSGISLEKRGFLKLNIKLNSIQNFENTNVILLFEQRQKNTDFLYKFDVVK